LPLPENPFGKLRLRLPPNRRERRLRQGALDRLIAAARSCRNPLILPIILLAVATGMRRGEILSLRWDHIACDKHSFPIPHTKNGHTRTLPLTSDAVEVIDRVTRTGGSGVPMTANAFRLAWDRVRARAGLADLHFHDLRHEAISRFFERGLTVPEVALISGHRDARMLFRYTHPLRAEIMKKLGTP
jgi:integrase